MLTEGVYQDSLQDTWWWRGRKLIIESLCSIRGTVLDIGCGNMPWNGAIAVDNHYIVHSAFNGVRADAIALPFGYDSADVLLALDLIEHIKADVAALFEFWRVLKPGGILVLTAPAHKWLWSLHDEQLGHYRRYTRRELRQKLSLFNVIKLTHFGGLVLPGQLLVRRGMQSVNGVNDIPTWLDTFLYGLLKIDAAILQHIPCIPLGGSILAICQKPS